MNKYQIVVDTWYRFEDWYLTRWQESGSLFWPLWWLAGPFLRLFNEAPAGLLLACPRCLCDDFDFFEEPFFECKNGGSYSSLDGITYWFEGIQMCPRCHHRFPVGDSS